MSAMRMSSFSAPSDDVTRRSSQVDSFTSQLFVRDDQPQYPPKQVSAGHVYGSPDVAPGATVSSPIDLNHSSQTGTADVSIMSKLEEMAARIISAEQEASRAKAELEKTTSELSSSKQELSTTKNELAKTVQERDSVKQGTTTISSRLQERTQKLASAEQEISSTKAQLQKTANELEIAKHEATTAKAELQKTASERDSAKLEIVTTKAELQKTINELNLPRHSALTSKAPKLDAPSTQPALGSISTPIICPPPPAHTLKIPLSTPVIPQPTKKAPGKQSSAVSDPGSRIRIAGVKWGDRSITDQKVFNKCKEAALSQQNVTFDSAFFGCEPTVGTVSYRYDLQGPMCYLTLREGATGRFEPLP